jgi:hypothetical protein
MMAVCASPGASADLKAMGSERVAAGECREQRGCAVIDCGGRVALAGDLARLTSSIVMATCARGDVVPAGSGYAASSSF